MTRLTRHSSGVLALCLLALPALAREKVTFSIDSSKSTLEIGVFKAGFLKVFSHDHLIQAKQISGQVEFDEQAIVSSSVSFRVDATSLTVIDPGESKKNRQKVQLTMSGESVLDTVKFPEITFRSTEVSGATRTSDGWELRLKGVFKLHGVEKTITIPMSLQAQSDTLRVRGEVVLRQTDYGITPVTVGGGSVRVKDEITITFDVVAVKANS